MFSTNFILPTVILLSNKHHAFCRYLNSYSIIFKKFGDPNKVLEKVECNLSEDLKPNQVLLKFLASPINPADINVIQGKYAFKPTLPATGGGEGIAEIIKLGSSVKNFQVGSRVVPPPRAASGTWKTHDVYEEKNLIEISKDISLHSAATISINPCSAYRMLKDFTDLKAGDTVIQNGANSAAGQAVIQIARHLKVNTLNVIRDRPDLESVKSYLYDLGATHVVSEKELRSAVMTEIFKQIPKPRLGLNCIGGKSAAELTRHMRNNATLVTYGGMSKQPLMISTACLIFYDIRLKGFWLNQWTNEHSREERFDMLSHLTDMIRDGALKPPALQEVDFDNFSEAIAKSMEGFVSKKQLLVMK